MSKVWKVVSAWPDGSLRSAVVGNYKEDWDRTTPWQRVYRTHDGTIVPVDNSIAVSTLHAAKGICASENCSDKISSLEVWEAECARKRKIKKVCCIGSLARWDWSRKEQDHFDFISAHPDTVLCQCLKLVRKV